MKDFTLQQALVRLLSRKFIATISSLTSAHILVSTGQIADGVYSAVMIAVVAAYVTANVAQKSLSKET